MVGNRTSESGEVSLSLTASARAFEANTLGPGKATGLGGGAASTGLSAGTAVSTEPLSIFPRRWAGATCVPNLGMVRGPPGPTLGPILLLLAPSSLASSNCTEIGGSSGLAIVKVAARSARRNSRR